MVVYIRKKFHSLWPETGALLRIFQVIPSIFEKLLRIKSNIYYKNNIFIIHLNYPPCIGEIQWMVKRGKNAISVKHFCVRKSLNECFTVLKR